MATEDMGTPLGRDLKPLPEQGTFLPNLAAIVIVVGALWAFATFVYPHMPHLAQ
jgi:hypothetical protein